MEIWTANPQSGLQYAEDANIPCLIRKETVSFPRAQSVPFS